MLEEYRKTYKNIAVIAHYHVLKTLAATKFSEEGEPLDSQVFMNATPFYYSLP